MNCFIGLSAGILSPILYLSCIYFFDLDGRDRNNEQSIKRRARGAVLACIVSFFAAHSVLSLTDQNALHLMGIRISGAFSAVVVPLILTAVLFLGASAMEIANGTFSYYLTWIYWKRSFEDLQFIRNCIVAPITEEVVFRAAVVPLIYSCVQGKMLLLIAPLPFALAHYHHIIEKKSQIGFPRAFLGCSFQAAYTYIFGGYSTFLFLRTGHVISSIVAHIYCNFMGFPPLDELFDLPSVAKKLFFISLYCLGTVLFAALIGPLTSPTLFNNKTFAL